MTVLGNLSFRKGKTKEKNSSVKVSFIVNLTCIDSSGKKVSASDYLAGWLVGMCIGNYLDCNN